MPGPGHSDEARARIGAARLARARANRARAVNGVTLADLQARGESFSGAMRIMGFSDSMVRMWERDSGLRFRRLTREEKRLIDAEAARADPGRADRLRDPEVRRRAALAWRRVRDEDPERWADIIRRRAETFRARMAADPSMRDAFVARLLASEDRRLAGIRAAAADPVRREMRVARREAARREAGPDGREGRRQKRLRELVGAFRARRLTPELGRELIGLMTAEELMLTRMAGTPEAALPDRG